MLNITVCPYCTITPFLNLNHPVPLAIIPPPLPVIIDANVDGVIYLTALEPACASAKVAINEARPLGVTALSVTD